MAGSERLRGPELLAPAGSPAVLPAAVAGGADAVYLGLPRFSARARAGNFSLEVLPNCIGYLHQHGLRCYLACNILVHEAELTTALDDLAVAVAAGIDAVIVQDLGLWQEIGRRFPHVRRHASTQMTVHDPAQIEVLAGLGARRIVLARELDRVGIAACVDQARSLGVEVECFVHGALCSSFSGQCLISSFASGRSANRGTCAQNCRFRFTGPDGDRVRSLALADLSLLPHLPDFVRSGVAALKIEGRLKNAAYVYAVCRAYRAGLDALAAHRPFDAVAAEADLRDVFTRGFTTGPFIGDWSEAVRPQRVAVSAEPDAYLMAISRREGTALIRSRQEIRPGTGFVFRLQEYEGGFLVRSAGRADGQGRIRCAIRIAEHGPFLPEGTPLWRNADHQHEAAARAAMAVVPLPSFGPRPVGLTLAVTGAIGQALRVMAVSDDGRKTDLVDDQPLVAATGRPLDEATVRASLGAFGGSGYDLAGLTLDLAGPCFAPVARLKALRRRLVEALDGQAVSRAAVAAVIPAAPASASASAPQRCTEVWTVVGSVAAVQAAVQAGTAAVVFDGPLIAPAWSGGRLELPSVAVPRWIRHPAALPLAEEILTAGCSILAGHLGVLVQARQRGLPVVADVALNAVNHATIKVLSAAGAQAVIVSAELSTAVLSDLAARCPEVSLGLMVHGRPVVMTTRQTHDRPSGEAWEISDDDGRAYRIERLAPAWTVIRERRTIVAPESIAATVGTAGIWLLELADAAPEEVAATVHQYRRLANGEVDPADLRRCLEGFWDAGVLPGHLDAGWVTCDQ